MTSLAGYGTKPPAMAVAGSHADLPRERAAEEREMQTTSTAPHYTFSVRRRIAAKLVTAIRQAAADGRVWPGVAAVYNCGHILTVKPAEPWRRPVEINGWPCSYCGDLGQREPKVPQPAYEVRRPFVGPSDPTRWREANTVSSHRTPSGARRSLARQQRGAASQGGYSQDVVVSVAPDGTVALIGADED